MKIDEHDCGHKTKMAARPIYDKNTYKFEQNLVCIIKDYKSLPAVDLDLFYGKVKFCN